MERFVHLAHHQDRTSVSFVRHLVLLTFQPIKVRRIRLGATLLRNVVKFFVALDFGLNPNCFQRNAFFDRAVIVKIFHLFDHLFVLYLNFFEDQHVLLNFSAHFLGLKHKFTNALSNCTLLDVPIQILLLALIHLRILPLIDAVHRPYSPLTHVD